MCLSLLLYLISFLPYIALFNNQVRVNQRIKEKSLQEENRGAIFWDFSIVYNRENRGAIFWDFSIVYNFPGMSIKAQDKEDTIHKHHYP